jgi:hypothetical protein
MSDYGNNPSALIKRVVNASDRDLLVRTARGFFAESMDAKWTSGAGAGATGVASYVAVGLFAGEVITNMTIYLSGAGSVITISKVGVYSSTGVFLAASADQGTNWQSTGAKTIALTAPYIVPVTGVYYLAELAVGTTAPSIVRGSGGNVFGQFFVGSSLATYYGQSGLADLPSPAVFATGIATASCFWCGLS